MCEVFLELIHDHGLLYCISLAKYEDKDKDSKILAHIANPMVFPQGNHLLDQIRIMIDGGIMVDDRRLKVVLFECHDLACAYTIVTMGTNSALKSSFCPWCNCTKKQSSQVVKEVAAKDGKSILSISLEHNISIALLKVSTC